MPKPERSFEAPGTSVDPIYHVTPTALGASMVGVNVDASANTAFGAGLVIRITGSTTITLVDEDELLPCTSVTVTVITCSPA